LLLIACDTIACRTNACDTGEGKRKGRFQLFSSFFKERYLKILILQPRKTSSPKKSSKKKSPAKKSTPAAASPVAKKEAKPKSAAKRKSVANKKAPKRVGKTPTEKPKQQCKINLNWSGFIRIYLYIYTARRSSSRSRAAVKAEKSPVAVSTRKTPTRTSARTNYALRNKVTIDDREVPMKGSHSNVSMSSKKSTGGGWFSKCAIV
jgi:hypothetical protein